MENFFGIYGFFVNFQKFRLDSGTRKWYDFSAAYGGLKALSYTMAASWSRETFMYFLWSGYVFFVNIFPENIISSEIQSQAAQNGF